MTQRIYWAPHTVCYFECEHCHNDSVLEGRRATPERLDRIIANLPGPDSHYRLEEVLVGGGEALMRGQHMEYLIRRFRERYPRGPQADIADRRAAGFVTLGLQTIGQPLCDARGRPRTEAFDYWLRLGVDFFHIASNDIFHERQRPGFPWEAMRENLRGYGDEHGVFIHIYGKSKERLVPSGRALDNLDAMEEVGAALLTAPGYCAGAWEAGANFLTGQDREHPNCSEVVIDPEGWVHPCCWYELAPGLFDLGVTPFEEGMRALREVGFAQAIDAGDMAWLAEEAGVALPLHSRMRNAVGDCGACRLYSVRLAAQHGRLKPTRLEPREICFYERYVARDDLEVVLRDFEIGGLAH
jgi:hypothetical protein